MGGSEAEWFGRGTWNPEVDRGLKSRSDHFAGVVSQYTLVQLLGHACK